MKNHKASIHGGVRYKCTQCQKQFTQQFQLKVFISSMHLGKQVHCERCDDQIGDGSALRAHIAAVLKGLSFLLLWLFRSKLVLTVLVNLNTQMSLSQNELFLCKLLNLTRN